MKLTGKDVHDAFVASYPYLEPNWEALKKCSQEGYARVASKLNKRLEADSVIITAIRCNHCGEMLQVAHAEGHACWLAES